MIAAARSDVNQDSSAKRLIAESWYAEPLPVAIRTFSFQGSVPAFLTERVAGSRSPVSIRVPFDLVERLSRVQRHDAVHPLTQAKNLARVNVDLRRLALDAAAHDQRLVNQDARVRQGKALALLARHQQKGAHAGRLADAQRRHVILDVLHRVVDRQAR